MTLLLLLMFIDKKSLWVMKRILTINLEYLNRNLIQIYNISTIKSSNRPKFKKKKLKNQNSLLAKNMMICRKILKDYYKINQKYREKIKKVNFKIIYKFKQHNMIQFYKRSKKVKLYKNFIKLKTKQKKK